jgi:hypothetical protein
MFYAPLLVLPLSLYPQPEQERAVCNSAFFALLMTTIFGSFCAACQGTGIIIKSANSRTPDFDVDFSFLRESCNFESNKQMLKNI